MKRFQVDVDDHVFSCVEYPSLFYVGHHVYHPIMLSKKYVNWNKNI